MFPATLRFLALLSAIPTISRYNFVPSTFAARAKQAAPQAQPPRAGARTIISCVPLRVPWVQTDWTPFHSSGICRILSSPFHTAPTASTTSRATNRGSERQLAHRQQAIILFKLVHLVQPDALAPARQPPLPPSFISPRPLPRLKASAWSFSFSLFHVALIVQ